MTNFPYGKAPFWILVLSVVTGIILLVVSGKSNNDSYDLVFVTFARSQLEGYQKATKEFEKEHGVRIHIQLVSDRAVKDRLQSALMTDAEVPDLVETLADEIADMALIDHRVRSARVRVEKLDILENAVSVGVEVERCSQV